MGRLAVAGQVGRTGAREKVQHADAAGDQVRVGQFAAADGAIDAFLDQVDGAVAAAHLQRDVRVAGEKIGQGGDDDVIGDAGGDVDAQASAGTGPLARQRFLGVAHVRQDAQAALIIYGAVGGDADVAGGAVQQLDRQGVFQGL